MRPIQLALTIMFLLVTAFGMIVFVASGSIVKSVAGVVGLGDTAVSVWTYAKWPVLGIVVALLLAILYWAAPNVKQPKLRWITPGGFIGLLALVVASALFAFYATNLSGASKTYGALAAVPIGLTWLWICNLAILFGAEFDAELERQRRIEGGMRPADAEPFLPVRDEPKETKDGGDLAREQFGGTERAQPTGRFTRTDGDEPRTEKRRSGGLVGKLRGR